MPVYSYTLQTPGVVNLEQLADQIRLATALVLWRYDPEAYFDGSIDWNGNDIVYVIVEPELLLPTESLIQPIVTSHVPVAQYVSNFNTVTSGDAIATITFSVDNVQNEATAYLTVPFDCVITQWQLLADEITNALVVVSRSTSAFFPVVSDIVSYVDHPILTAQTNATSTNLSNWNRVLIEDEILIFKVQFINPTTTKLVLNLKVLKS